MRRQTDHFSRVSIETSDYEGQMIKPFPPIILTSLTMPLNSAPAQNAADGHRPNILWIVVEDASPHLGCYGETTIETPNLDRLAREGVRYENAVVTCPVCSPGRSAMVTGMVQTTLGAHNHRSQRDSGKGSGNKAHCESYELPVKSIPTLFGEAGYHVTNSSRGRSGKQDYNFVDWGS